MVKDFEQPHLIPPKMRTKLEISRQAELFPSSGFIQPRKVVLFRAIVRVAAEQKPQRWILLLSQTND